MNSHRITVKEYWFRLGMVSCLVTAAVPLVAQETGYVPPPSGPYQSSAVVIEGAGDATTSERQVYRFPPSNILMPEVEPRQFRELERQPVAKPPGIPLPPSTPQIPDSQRTQQPQAEAWVYPDYSTGAQMYSAPQNWYGYQGGAWQQSAPGYGYYPYVAPEQYPQRFAPFDNMPSPWSVIPNNPFSGRNSHD
jgi:hypothetical protein